MNYASALSYPEGIAAPLIVCNGKGSIAKHILQIAKEEGVPIFHNVDTAKILSCCEINSCIPKETWKVLAGVFAYIQKVESNDIKK